MMLGGAPRRSQRDERNAIPDLLGQLQKSVDQAKADRHPKHTYVATAKSGIDLHCPGRSA